MSRASLAALTLSLVVSTTTFSHASPIDDRTRNAARSLAQSGAVAYESGEYERALELFRRAYALIPAPTISIYEARCLAKLGLLIEASERYEQTRHAPAPADAPPAFRKAQEDAERELVDVRERTPHLRIKIDGAASDSNSLRVMLDGEPVRQELIGAPITVNPGLHRIAANLPGTAYGKATVLAQERQFHLVSVPLVPYADEPRDRGPVSRPAASNPRNPWGYAFLGVGAAGLAVGVTSAVIAGGKRSDLDSECSGGRCPASAESDLGAYRSARTASFIGYGVGAAGLATGAVLLFWPNKESNRVGVVPSAGIGSIGAAGRF